VKEALKKSRKRLAGMDKNPGILALTGCSLIKASSITFFNFSVCNLLADTVY
jgi:hypothetical protein